MTISEFGDISGGGIAGYNCYNLLKADVNYKRKVTWLEPATHTRDIACVEYVGLYPGAMLHGNAKGRVSHISVLNLVF